MLRTDQTVSLAANTYRLLQPLGDGSSHGEVWLARPLSGQGRNVALKFVNEAALDSSDVALRARLKANAQGELHFLRTLSPWDGRYIVRLVDHGQHNGMPVIALEHMATDLRQHLSDLRDAGATLSVPQALEWMRQVNHALARVHDRGWRYLDLKPSNLLLDTTRTELRLADFGTNRAMAMQPEHSFIGTPGWQAPEQVFASANSSGDGRFCTDPRADYFSLGMLFYALVTGGQTLRFGANCRDAFAAHQEAVGRHLTADPPLALLPAECELFARCFDAGIQPVVASANTWRANVPHSGNQSATTHSHAATCAVNLLSALLAWAPENRPLHEAHIARGLDRIRRALPALDTAAKTRASPPVPAYALRVRLAGAALWRAAHPWFWASVLALLAAGAGLMPAARAKGVQASMPHQTVIDLPRCVDLGAGLDDPTLRIGVVEPASPALLRYVAGLADVNDNMQACAESWTTVLPRLTPWASVPAMDKHHGWVAFVLGLLLTLGIFAVATPRRWWRGGPSLLGWCSLAAGTWAVACGLLLVANRSGLTRSVLYADAITIQRPQALAVWHEVDGVRGLNRLLEQLRLPLVVRAHSRYDEPAVPGRFGLDPVDGLHAMPPLPGYGFRTKQAVNLRGGPGVDHPRLSTLPRGQRVTVTGERLGDWWVVTTGQGAAVSTGWVSSLWLRRELE